VLGRVHRQSAIEELRIRFGGLFGLFPVFGHSFTRIGRQMNLRLKVSRNHRPKTFVRVLVGPQIGALKGLVSAP